LEGKKYYEITAIQEEFSHRRDDLYKRSGKATEENLKDESLKRREYLQSDQKEAEKIQKENIESMKASLEKEKELRLYLQDQTFKAKDVAFRQSELEQLQNVEGTELQKQEKIKELQKQFKRDAINRFIGNEQKKLEISGLTPKERTDIESNIIDKQKELYDLDAKNYKESQDEKTKETKKQADERKEAEKIASKLALDFIKEGFAFRSDKIKEENEQIKGQKEEELKRAGDNVQAKAQIEAKYKALERANRLKQFEADKQQALFNIAINTAQAISKTIAMSGPIGIVLSFGVAALGLAQAARVNSQKPPKYKFGTRKVEGVDTGSDTVTAILRPGERVTTTEQSNTYGKLFDNMQNINPKLANDFALNHRQYDRALNGNDKFKEELSEMKNIFKELRKDIKNRPEIHIELTEKGFKKTIVNTQSETEITNDYFKI
jgi:hypothetical protein